jgi:hypothetical protein
VADSILRRSANSVELLLDKRASAQSIRVETSPDLATWTQRVDLPSKESPVNGLGSAESFRGKVYYNFQPDDYSLNYPFFMRFRPVTGGTPGDPGAAYIAHHPLKGGNQFYILTGTAPTGAALANSQQLQLPVSTEMHISNGAASNPLVIAFAEDGPEKTLAPGADLNVEGRVDTLYVRGSGGTATFELRLTLQY